MSPFHVCTFLQKRMFFFSVLPLLQQTSLSNSLLWLRLWLRNSQVVNGVAVVLAGYFRETWRVYVKWCTQKDIKMKVESQRKLKREKKTHICFFVFFYLLYFIVFFGLFCLFVRVNLSCSSFSRKKHFHDDDDQGILLQHKYS